MAAANLPERVELVLGGAAVSLLIVFLGALRATLRREEGEAGALSATTVIGGSVLAAAALVALAAEDEDLRALLAFPAATTLVAAALGILSTGALPRWLAYTGLGAAALQLSAAFSLDELAIAAFAAWALLASG
ncbi:MAG TPA: hypothetical protein VFL61_14345, partial [Gaiellaceae bacterium]|nr:hypothetical protein [Gaiellaceae bacterium]